MEDNRPDSMEQAASFAANTAHAVIGAVKTGRNISGMAAGAAAGGPLGAAVAYLATKKTFWKAILSVVLAVILFISIIVNMFGILMTQFGLMDADGYVGYARNQEAADIQKKIEELMESNVSSFGKIFDMLNEKQEIMHEEITEDYGEGYGSLENYELELTDEYEELLKPHFARYMAVLFASVWNGSQVRSFLGNGTVDLYSTELTSIYDEYFEQAQEKYNVSAALLKAVAKVESDFTPDAVSKAGAVGIMQLMPSTAKALGVTDPYDPKQSIMGGAKYLADSQAVFGGYDNAVELMLASYHAGAGAVKKAGYRIPQNGQTQEYVDRVLGYVRLAESGSLTPGRESPQESSDKGLQMFLREVYGRQDQFFEWTKEGVREEERESTVYYLGDGSGKREISEEDYQKYLQTGERGLSTEKKTETWHVVSYRIVNLLEGSPGDMKGSYSYKYVTTPQRFLRAIEMLKFLTENMDQEAFFRKFGWKELVFGYGPTDLSYATDVETDGETIEYDTADGCVKEVVYYNQTEEPWASMSFDKTTIKAAGCGPTAMAMVISTLGKSPVTPQDVAAFTVSENLYVPGKGTSHSLPGMAAKNWGLTATRVKDTQMKLVEEELKSGAMAVVICGEYTITGSGSGHYIVLTGVTDEGFFAIADPASRTRSGRVYSADTIQAYARDLDAGSIWIMKKE